MDIFIFNSLFVDLDEVINVIASVKYFIVTLLDNNT